MLLHQIFCCKVEPLAPKLVLTFNIEARQEMLKSLHPANAVLGPPRSMEVSGTCVK